MTNPYAPPRSDLRSSAASGRPLLVWILSAYVGFASLTNPLIAVGMLSGALPSNSPTDVAALGAYLWVRTATSSVLGGAFAVQLFRLRAVAVSLAWAMTIFSIVNSVISALIRGEVILPYLVTGLGGVAMWVATSFYAHRLRARGVLR